MENTSLRLLARDGPFTVTFTPGLTSEQYADLHQVVTDGNALRKTELCQKLKALASVWEVKFETDILCD